MLLGHVVPGALLQQLDRMFLPECPGNEDERNLWCNRSGDLQCLLAVEAGQRIVRENEVRWRFGQLLGERLSRVDHLDSSVDPGRLESPGGQLGVRRHVLEDEDAQLTVLGG